MKHTKAPWLMRLSTPSQESKIHGGRDAGALAYIYAYDGKTLFGRQTTKTIAYMPHWRKESETEEHVANMKLMIAAPVGLNAAIETYISVLQIEDNLWRARNQHVYCALRDYIALATGATDQEVQERYEQEAIAQKINLCGK